MNQIAEFKIRQINADLARKLYPVVWVLSIAVLGLVLIMRQYKIPLPDGVDLSFLPPFHAVLNGLAASFLILAVFSIKAGKVESHRFWILLALGCSVVFLLSYVCYHFTTEETKYGGEGWKRTVYFIILITHVFLAAASFPFILMTFVYSLTNQFEKHKKLSKKIFPIWLYVAITGPVVYLMLSPYY